MTFEDCRTKLIEMIGILITWAAILFEHKSSIAWNF